MSLPMLYTQFMHTSSRESVPTAVSVVKGNLMLVVALIVGGLPLSDLLALILDLTDAGTALAAYLV